MSVGASDIAVPLAALLPPPPHTSRRDREQAKAARACLGFADDTPDAHDTPLPRYAAILGPLPPSAPLSVAVSFLNLADLPPFENDPIPGEVASPPRSAALAALPAAEARALILTGRRAALHLSLEDQDPAFLREHERGLFDRLRRTDVRYCPSVEHLKLLLAILHCGEGRADKVFPPSMVVLYDVLGLMTVPEERDENVPQEEEWVEGEVEEGCKVLRPG